MNFGPAIPIGTIRHRQRAVVAGVVRAVEVRDFSGVPALECTLADTTGSILIVFLGRRKVAGAVVGAHLTAEGMVGVHRRTPAIVNPEFTTAEPRAEGGVA